LSLRLASNASVDGAVSCTTATKDGEWWAKCQLPLHARTPSQGKRIMEVTADAGRGRAGLTDDEAKRHGRCRGSVMPHDHSTWNVGSWVDI
jgi:hypothetical protein